MTRVTLGLEEEVFVCEPYRPNEFAPSLRDVVDE